MQSEDLSVVTNIDNIQSTTSSSYKQNLPDKNVVNKDLCTRVVMKKFIGSSLNK